MSQSTDAIEHGTMTIRGQEIPIQTTLLLQSKLKFFVENPRIYSLVRSGGKEPDQTEIYKKLLDLEHVRELKEDIKLNGGLIDPLIVRSGDLEVLEGNSRLAAYRWLYENVDPIAWAKVKCTLLPAETDEKLIFALLGQYHVKGKKDWAPYEKAGFLYRRFRAHNEDLPTIAGELGISQKEARHLIDVYEFMGNFGETDRDKWSYYDEYLKSRKIRKVREQFPKFDSLIVRKIRTGEIKRAVDVRDELSVVCASSAKTVKKFVEGTITLSEAHAVAVEGGGENADYLRLNKFRKWLAEADTEEDLVGASKPVRDKIAYELGSLEKRVKKLKEKLEKAVDA